MRLINILNQIAARKLQALGRLISGLDAESAILRLTLAAAPTFRHEDDDREIMLKLIAAIKNRTELVISDNYFEKYTLYTSEHWVPAIGAIVAALSSIAAEA